MRVKLLVIFLVISLFCSLGADHIRFISESMPSLGDLAGLCQYGNYGFVYGDTFGTSLLNIIDFSDAAAPLVPFAPWGYSPFGIDMHIYGNIAYLNSYSKILIISLENVLSPVVLSSFYLEGGGCQIQLYGDYLYSINGYGRLISYSLNDPLSPVAVDTLETGWKDIHNFVAGAGFIACQNDSIGIVDSSNPEDLVLGGKLDYGETSPAGYVAASGKYLYCNSANDFSVFSLENPASPLQVGQISLDCQDLGHKNYICNNILWTLYRDGEKDTDDKGLMAIDLSFPTAPALLSKHSLAWTYAWDSYRLSRFMRASGNMLYLNYYPYHLKIASLEGGNFTELEPRYPLSSISKIVANEDHIVGLSPIIQELKYDENKVLQPYQQIEPDTYRVDTMGIMDDLLLCASQYTANHEIEGILDPSLSIYNLVSGSKAGRFSIPNEADFPAVPVDIQRYQNYALLCTGLGGVYCIDLSDPAQPQQRFVIKLLSYSYNSVTAADGELWLGYSFLKEAYLSCYDISDIDHPVLKKTIPLGRTIARKLLKIGDYMYVLQWEGFVSYYIGADSERKESAYSVSHYYTEFNSMMPFGKGLLFGTEHGIYVFSLNNPLNPEMVGSCRLFPGFKEEQPYEQGHYAVDNTNILLADGYRFACYDASLAALLCEDVPEFISGKLLVFPNPAREKISVHFTRDTNMYDRVTLQVFNIRGQKVISKVYSRFSKSPFLKTIELKDDDRQRLAAGIYIVKCVNGSSTEFSKLVVLP